MLETINCPSTYYLDARGKEGIWFQLMKGKNGTYLVFKDKETCHPRCEVFITPTQLIPRPKSYSPVKIISVRGHFRFTSHRFHAPTSLPIVFRPRDHFRGLLNWKHCGTSSATLPTLVGSHPTILLFVSVVIFIMAWSHHAICHHTSHRTILHFIYYFIVRF